MAAPAPNTVSERYEQFQAETAKIPFVKIPKAVLEATMQDQLATIWQRVYAYVVRYSWGNYSFYAINDDGTPRLQRDCAKELGIPKQAVSKAVQYGITRGYLQDELKILYPLLAPQLANCKKVAPLGDFSWATFMEQWKVANSTTFSQLEVARSTVKRIQKVALSDYKKWRASATNGAASLYEIKKTLKTEDSPPPQPSLSSAPPDQRKEEEEGTPPSIDPPPDPGVPAVIEAEFVPEEPTFEEFASQYPGHVDPDSRPAFEALNSPDRIHLMRALPAFRTCGRWVQTPQYIPHASNFIKKRAWEFKPPPGRSMLTPQTERTIQTHEEIKLMMASLKRGT